MTGQPEARRCTGRTVRGEPCSNRARDGEATCHYHGPELQAAVPGRCTGTGDDGRPCPNPARTGESTCTRHNAGNTANLVPPDERRCTATASGGYSRPERRGARCQAWAMRGTTVCVSHGGMGVRRRQESAMAVERVRHAAATYGLKVETTPEQAILDEVQWTAGHVAWLRGQVQQIEAEPAPGGDGDGDDADGAQPRRDSLIWGVTRRKTGGEDHGVTEEAAAHIYLKLYQQERAHLVKVCETAIRCGIEERRVRLAEQQGHLVAQTIRSILADLNLSPEQQALVAHVVPQRLRELVAATN